MTFPPPDGTSDTERITAPMPVVRQRRGRRLSLLPVLIGVAAGVLVTLLVIAIVTMLAGGTPAPVVPSPTSTAPPVAVPSQGPTTPAAPPPPPVAPRPDPGPNECVDALGDGGFDLDGASISRDDDALVVSFTVASPLPDGDSGVGVIISDRRGQRAYQLGVAMSDGELDRVFVVNLARGDDEDDLDLDKVRLDGQTIVASFPDDVLRRLGDDWRWYAFATATGSELDACPGTAQDPGSLTFAG